MRLRGPLGGAPKVSVGTTKEQGGDCKGSSTQDLILMFEQTPSEWLEGLANLKEQKSDQDLCDVSARPTDDGKFEIRLSYERKKGTSTKTLKTLSYMTGSGFVVDHWFVSAKSLSASEEKKKKPQKTEEPTATESQGSQMATTAGTLVEVFDDESAWDRLLGNDAMAFDLNSPELNRFRFVGEKQAVKPSSEPVERQALRPPFFEIPSLERALSFNEEGFVFREFTEESLGKIKKKSLNDETKRKIAIALKGMNYIQSQIKQADWLKASAALEILNKSQGAAYLPIDDPQWWAVKGILMNRLGKQLKQPKMVRSSYDLWRDGARRTAGAAGTSQQYVEYMVVELVRQLMTDNLPYPAASVLSWAKKYSWSQRIEERFAYLRGEAYYNMGLGAESHDEFMRFIRAYEDKPLNSAIDRRLISSAFFRLGDIEFREQHFKEAAKEYSDAIQNMPTVAKFSFESNWYPDEVKLFPHVLFNRAEALIHQGYYQQGLKDLRGFIYVAPTHPDVGLVLYKIGEVLDFMGASEEMVVNAWRECTFKVPETLGAKLCEAKKSARELAATENKEKWPRLIGAIEEAKPQIGKTFWKRVDKDSLETFISIVLADAFLKHAAGRQAMFRLDPALKLSPQSYLRIWLEEYAYTAFAGTLYQDVKEGHYKDVVNAYEARKRALLFKQTKPEILWYLSKAYEKLGLPEQAEQVLTEAERVRKIIDRKVSRPFDESDHEWALARARLDLALFSSNKKTADVVEVSLKNLSEEDADSLKMWTEFYTKTGRYADAAKKWKKLAAVEFLDLDQVRSYSEVLKKLDANDTRLELLETRVGVWLSEKEKVGLDKMPPADLLVDLAELRSQQKNRSLAALAIYDFLLTLEPSKLTGVDSPALVPYRRAELLKNMGRTDDARRGFEQAMRLDPDGIWGRLASSAQKELNGATSAQAPKK